jgi:GxxExxY protein
VVSLNRFNRGGPQRDGEGRRVSSINSITEAVIGDAIVVHRELGPGMLESTYEAALAMLLARRGLTVDRQVAMPAIFQGVRLDTAYRLDLLVENRVVVELKTVAMLQPVHLAQMNTYLRFSGCEVGLLINFNVTRLVDGLRRVITYATDASAPSHSSLPSVIDSVKPPRAR